VRINVIIHVQIVAMMIYNGTNIYENKLLHFSKGNADFGLKVCLV